MDNEARSLVEIVLSSPQSDQIFTKIVNIGPPYSKFESIVCWQKGNDGVGYQRCTKCLFTRLKVLFGILQQTSNLPFSGCRNVATQARLEDSGELLSTQGRLGEGKLTCCCNCQASSVR